MSIPTLLPRALAPLDVPLRSLNTTRCASSAEPGLTSTPRCGSIRQHLNKTHRLAVPPARPVGKTYAVCCLHGAPDCRILRPGQPNGCDWTPCRSHPLAWVAGEPLSTVGHHGKSRLGRGAPLSCQRELPWQAPSTNQESHGFSRVECQLLDCRRRIREYQAMRERVTARRPNRD